MPRRDLHAATIISGVEEVMFALAGINNNQLNTVEEWVEENSTWVAADSLAEKRYFFGGVAVPKKFICPLNQPSEYRLRIYRYAIIVSFTKYR